LNEKVMAIREGICNRFGHCDLALTRGAIYGGYSSG